MVEDSVFKTAMPLEMRRETRCEASLQYDGAQGVASGPRARRTEHRNRNVLQVREDSEHRTNAAPGPRSSRERSAVDGGGYYYTDA
jgi:hypothetical protein